MNTQQKRVKWSRGETTDALEERTDTGITNVSAEFMENVVCDIYGNVSRRPALKLLPYATDVLCGLITNKDDMCIPFFIKENDVIILFQRYAFRIKDRVVVKRINPEEGVNVSFKIDRETSYAQQNNYLIVANKHGIYKATLVLEENSDDFTVNIENFIYSGGWYAPNGTSEYSVSNNEITGLLFNEDKKGASSWIATNPDGSNTIYSFIDTGVTAAELQAFSESFPEGCIITMPNLGCSFRVEGYKVGDSQLLFSTVLDGVLAVGANIPTSGVYARLSIITQGVNVELWDNNVLKKTVIATGGELVETVDGWYSVSLHPTQWNQASASSLKLYVYGALLTPIVDKSLTDSAVTVQTGYINLSRDGVAGLPRPSVVVFKDQRLWASGYVYDITGDPTLPTAEFYTYPGLVVSSQIAKYTDFKNDYNYENEAITLDVLTKFKEEVIYLVEYNGLKIFTDYAEYDYRGAALKQSENGALKGCQPLVFGSLLLYADKTGHQIKAMQYELQSNIFASNIVNKLVPQDLVGNPVRFAGEEEKEHYVGRFLYVLNTKETSPTISVCDFVPDTQNIIWSRYAFGWAGKNLPYSEISVPPILDIVPIKKPIFAVAVCQLAGGNRDFAFAEWDYDAILDFQTELEPTDTLYKIAIDTMSYITIGNATVAVYDGDKYMWDDTTDGSGQLSKSLSSLTRPIVGIPINAKIRSHPIDVGGKTKSIAKRISKSLLSMRNTNAGAITVNKKTGYWNPDNSYVNFYNCTGMKREVKLEIENIHSAKFTIESVLMNIEYGTLVS